MRDMYKFLFLSTIIALIIAVVILVIYNFGFTPANQKDEIEKINRYLAELIDGFN